MNTRLENPVVVPHVLSYLAYGSFGATVQGLDDVPRGRMARQRRASLLRLSRHGGSRDSAHGPGRAGGYHARIGRLWSSRAILWAFMLAAPFPYIATTAGWMTAELGRQPWTVYGVLRTAEGPSPKVSTGDVAFSTIGFMGLYLLLGIAFLFLVARMIAQGPVSSPHGKA